MNSGYSLTDEQKLVCAHLKGREQVRTYLAKTVAFNALTDELKEYAQKAKMAESRKNEREAAEEAARGL